MSGSALLCRVASQLHLAGAPAAGDMGEDWKVHPEDVAGVVRTLLQMPERTMVSQVEVRPAKPKRS